MMWYMNILLRYPFRRNNKKERIASFIYNWLVFGIKIVSLVDHGLKFEEFDSVSPICCELKVILYI